MATIQTLYGSNNQAITLTLNSLAASATAGRASTAVDNTSNKYLDALVQLDINMPGSGTIGGTKAVYVYAYGTVDGGTTYTDGASGTDAALTPPDPPNLRLIGVISCPTNTGTYKGGPFSVAAAFGGVLPDHWGIFVRNDSNLTLNAASNVARYQGVRAEAV